MVLDLAASPVACNTLLGGQDAAMRAAWEKIPPSTMTNISKRVRRNMLKVIEQKGGNFYDE